MQKSVDLVEFINHDMASILADWDEFAETVNPSLMMNRDELLTRGQQS